MSYHKKIEIIEMVLIKFVALIFTTLIIVIISTNYQHYIQSVDSDAQTILSDPLVSSGSITIKLDQHTIYPELEVWVNGEVYTRFDHESQLVLQVFDKDLIQINGQMYHDLITVQIVHASDNVKLLLYDGQVGIEGDIEILSAIQI